MKNVKQCMSISNEFATVLLAVDLQGNGPRLIIKSIKDNKTIFIDPLELDFIASLSREQLTSVIENIIDKTSRN